MISKKKSPFPMTSRYTPARAFTLIELMVAVGLIVLLIAAVGLVFQSASGAVGLSEASNDIFARARAINQQITSDVHSIDKSGFLIIRSYADPASGRRYDQISFTATGVFPNRTGAYQQANLFSDTTVSNSARIWYGQLVMQADTSTSDQNTAVTLNTLPNSTVANTSDPTYEGGFVLGRQAMLMISPPSSSASVFPAGYTTISQYDPPATSFPGTDTPFATTATTPAGPAGTAGPMDNVDTSATTKITSSRCDVAYATLPQIMQPINAGTLTGMQIVGNFCYRLKSLSSPTQTKVANGSSAYVPNGVFRMHPIFSQGVPSFQVDWTDGSASTDVTTPGALQWFGIGNASGDIHDATVTNDQYVVAFTPKSAAWPKALRFTYRLTDSNNRLNGGRTFVCIVDLPQ